MRCDLAQMCRGHALCGSLASSLTTVVVGPWSFSLVRSFPRRGRVVAALASWSCVSSSLRPKLHGLVVWVISLALPLAGEAFSACLAPSKGGMGLRFPASLAGGGFVSSHVARVATQSMAVAFPLSPNGAPAFARVHAVRRSFRPHVCGGCAFCFPRRPRVCRGVCLFWASAPACLRSGGASQFVRPHVRRGAFLIGWVHLLHGGCASPFAERPRVCGGARLASPLTGFAGFIHGSSIGGLCFAVLTLTDRADFDGDTFGITYTYRSPARALT